MATLILRWSSTDNCVPSPKENDSCTAFSSITTGCWSRSSSPERYFCFEINGIQTLGFCLSLLGLMWFLLQELLDFAVHNGLDFPPKRRLATKTHTEMRDVRVRRRLSRILKEVKTECGDSNASSDDDGLSVFLISVSNDNSIIFYTYEALHWYKSSPGVLVALQTYHYGLQHLSHPLLQHPQSHSECFRASPPKTWKILVRDLSRTQIMFKHRKLDFFF